MTQGKCFRCKVAFRWKGKPLLREALCPRCKEPLSKTSRHLKSLPWVEEHPHWLVGGPRTRPYRGEG